ncbi:putative transmembrane protein [Plasmopara halstedii]
MPHLPSTASNLHVTASDISLFSHSDDDPMCESEGITREQLAARTLISEQQEDNESEMLGQELLEALRLGTSNFLLAYNIRAGIAVLLRLFKLLQRQRWKAVTNLPQILDEKHLHFRVDAVRLGMFLGWFTGSYRALRALLPVILRRVVRKNRFKDKERLDKISALGSGAIAALVLGFVDERKRRSLALYMFTRALQCGYNTAKRHNRWHFWGSDWQYGDLLLFALSSAQVMYAYVMRPTTLPLAYFRFIQRASPLKQETRDMVQLMNRSSSMSPAISQRLMDRNVELSKNYLFPADIVPCKHLHASAESCVVGALLCFKNAFQKTFPLYMSLFTVPGVVIHFKSFLQTPLRTLARSTFNATRSSCFLASFVTLYLSIMCVHRRIVSKDHRFVYYLAGLGASTTILLEPKSRRSELALYVLPRALDSLAMILNDHGVCVGFKFGEVALFSFSMSVLMYCYEHEKESMSPFLYSTMKRFLQTSTDKKQLYIAFLEKRERCLSQLVPPTSTIVSA